MKSLAITISVLTGMLLGWQVNASPSSTIRLLDAAGVPVSGAVIYVDTVADQSALMQPPVIVEQINKQFVPRVTVIQTGAQVEFPNRDAVSHHVYSFANPNGFELPLYKGEAKPKVRFNHAGLVTLGCNIHDSMLGYILVVDTPYHAITDVDGLAELSWIEQLTADAEMHVWSPDLADGEVLTAKLRSLDELQPNVEKILAVEVTQDKVKGVTSEDSDGSLSWDDY